MHSNYLSDPLERELFYTLDGIGYSATITVYNGLKAYFFKKAYSEGFYYYQDFMYDTHQRKYMNDLIQKIVEKTRKPDDWVRIAVSLVQHISYDTSKAIFELKSNPNCPIRYPYETIYDNKGICCEKSILLAFIIKELGYGVALLLFNEENHMATGVKCPIEYSFNQSGYAFVETTSISIITDHQSDYRSSSKAGCPYTRLKSIPEIIPISGGESFDSVDQEWFDAREYRKIIDNRLHYDGGYYFKRYLSLVRKYGL